MSDVVLSWVLPDPNRERSVDPLGTAAFAEQIADKLVPDFSTQTSRARYLSLLCAAVRRADSAAKPLALIHHIEAKHAVLEARLHRDEGPDACRDVVGKQRATAELIRLDWHRLTRPERLYKTTAFNTYRSLLRRLGFLVGRSQPKLSPAGDALARAYPLHGSAERRCLNEITKPECSQLYGPLGLDGRASLKPGSPQALRRATWEHLRSYSTLNGRNILQTHARLSAREGDVGRLLHLAYAWETVSVGLLSGLSLLVRKNRLSLAAKELKTALNRRPVIPRFDESFEPEDAADHTVALLREAMKVQKTLLGRSCECHLKIARLLVVDRDPRSFLRALVEQHRLAKGGEAWFRLLGDRVDVLATGKNLNFPRSPRSYRLDAYSQFLRDLGKL